MQKFVLYLFPFEKEQQILELRPNDMDSANDVLKTTNKVFSNLSYSGQLEAGKPNKVENFQLFVNNTLVDTIYNPNDGSFQIAGKPFMECYGYVQLTIKFTQNGTNYNMTTGHISVMVSIGRQNESIKRMAAYVYKYNDLLFNDNASFSNNLKYNEHKSLDVRLILLKNFVRTFKVNYPHFKNKSQFTTVQSECIDRFEKLRNITANTIKFIAQHPEQLRRNSLAAGVQVGRYTYQPEKTLITNNVTSYDIIENRTIVNFIYTLLSEIKNIKTEIEKLITNLPTTPITIDNYVESNFFIYSNAAENLTTKLPEVIKLENQYAQLLTNYSAIYGIKGEKMITKPKPTVIFLSIPQYRQVYDCMASWFSLGAFNPNEEKQLFNFVKISALYEVYVLLKIVNYLKENDYEFTKRGSIYKFARGEYKITIYYQPMIYNRSNDTGLYRNNSIKFPAREYMIGGSYYVPDVVIKIEDNEKEGAKFIIVDAKYSTVENVKLHQVANLVFKYLFSLSPLKPIDEISGLYIINGQTESDTDEYTPIYDKSLGNIKPAAEIITLTENVSNNAAIHDELISRIFRME